MMKYKLLVLLLIALSVQARFTQVDPHWAKYPSFTPYNYAVNNPLKYVDPDGREVKNPNNFSIQPQVMKALNQYNQYIGLSHDVIVLGGDRPGTSALGAGRNSQHVLGNAADFYVPGTGHLEAANAAVESGAFSGVGWYEEGFQGSNGEGPHVHGDIREGRSKTAPAKWGHPVKSDGKAVAIPQYDGEPTLDVNKVDEIEE